MTTHKHIDLETITEDIGIIAFLRWQSEATRAWKDSEYFYKGADAKHAFEYEHIRKRYDTLCEHRRAAENAGRIC